jgi:hypothetical protein
MKCINYRALNTGIRLPGRENVLAKTFHHWHPHHPFGEDLYLKSNEIN